MALRAKTKPKVLVPSAPKGKRDPKFTDLIRVPASAAPQHPSLPKLNPEMNFMGITFYAFDPKAKRVRHMVTVMPDGLSAAWDTCRVCKLSVSMCQCRTGVQVPRSIEWIYDTIVADRAGEEWNIVHPSYYGSLTKAMKAKNAPRVTDWERGRNVTTAEQRAAMAAEAAKQAGGKAKLTPAKKTAQKAVQRVPGRKLKPKPKPPAEPKPVDLNKIDMGTLQGEAQSLADRLQDELAASLDAATAKKPAAKKAPLKKKATVPAKKATTTKKTGGLRKKR